MATKSIVFLSDFQVGHDLAILPPKVELQSAAPASPSIVYANDVQKALYRAYMQLVKAWGRPDILVLNGEPIDGQQSKNMGVEVVTANLHDQLNIAKDLIELWNAKSIYLTRGTDYHSTLKGIPLEEVFGEMVGAEFIKGHYAPHELQLEEEGVRFNIAHHIGGSRWMHYRHTPISRELAQHLINVAIHRKWEADVLIRSHAHYYVYAGNKHMLGIVTPAWQTQTWYSFRGGTGYTSDIGGIRFLVKDGEYNWESEIFDFPEFQIPRVVNGKVIDYADSDVKSKRNKDILHKIGYKPDPYTIVKSATSMARSPQVKDRKRRTNDAVHRMITTRRK